MSEIIERQERIDTVVSGYLRIWYKWQTECHQKTTCICKKARPTKLSELELKQTKCAMLMK